MSTNPSQTVNELEPSEDGFQTGLGAISQAFEKLIAERPGMLASEAGGELDWLKRARQRDALRWRTEGLPTRKNERWKYTSLTRLQGARVTLPLVVPPVKLTCPELRSLPGAIDLVFYNGEFMANWSNLQAQPGLRITSLSALFAECVEQGWSSDRQRAIADFKAHVESSDTARETVFAAMNTSFMQDVLLLHVEKDAQIAPTIVVTYLSDAPVGETVSMSSTRLFAHLERGAKLSVLEVHRTLRADAAETGDALTNAVTDLRLEEGSFLSHCRVQDENLKTMHFSTTRLRAKRAAVAETFQFSFGASLSRHDLHVTLEGEGAEVALDGLYLARGEQHVDNYTLVDHLVPHTTSDQLYKGILDDAARAVFNGHVRILPDAQKSSAGQANHNLMLSAKAEVDTRPELEIDADDVKAAHGATIGRMDPESLFYLQSRAIDPPQASRMLAEGFAQDVTFRMKHPAMWSVLRTLVRERFTTMEVSHELP